METMKAKDLQLGDIVTTIGNDSNKHPYCHATVQNIDEEKELVYLFRPYTHTSDFSCVGGVICYIGIEHYWVSFTTEVVLIERGRTLK
jgi:hypothetical protein